MKVYHTYTNGGAKMTLFREILLSKVSLSREGAIPYNQTITMLNNTSDSAMTEKQIQDSLVCL